MLPTTRTAARIAAHMARAAAPLPPRRRPAEQANAQPTAGSYYPRPGSVIWQLLAFFARNPGEELTINDAAVKFNTTPRTLHSSTKAAQTAGFLGAKYAPGGNNQALTVYSVGEQLHTVLGYMHSHDPDVPTQLAADE